MHKTLNNLAIKPQVQLVTRNKRPIYETRHSPDPSRLSKYSNLDAWETKGTQMRIVETQQQSQTNCY